MSTRQTDRKAGLVALVMTFVLMGAQAQMVENQWITVAPGVYRFGVDTKWVYGYITQAATCTRQTFGGTDPVPGVVKRCEVVTINQAACILPIMGGAGLNPSFSFSATTGTVASWWCGSSKGPQLRLMAGSTLATLAAMKCFVTSDETPSKTLGKCAGVSVMTPALRSIWEPSITQILATVPK